MFGREEYGSIRRLAIALIVLSSIVTVLCLLLGLFGASLAPVWMFINAMQLLAYSALVDIPLPANSACFLSTILDAVRFNLLGVGFSFDEGEADNFSSAVKFSNWLRIQAFGYSPRLFSNLGPLLCIFAFLALVCLAGALRVAYQLKRHCLYSHKALKDVLMEPTANFMTRFCYQFFLEITVVVFLALAMAFNWVDLTLTVILFLGLLAAICASCLLVKEGATKHAEKVYRPRGLLSRALCCMERREFDEEIVDPLTWRGVEELADF